MTGWTRGHFRASLAAGADGAAQLDAGALERIAGDERSPPRPPGTAAARRGAEASSGGRAIVIGSGFGGLAAAIRLGARGWRVTVLEKRSTPGGRAHVIRDQGYVFDAGPTIITAPFLLDELWELAGRRRADDVTLVPCDPFYRIRFHDGAEFACSGDADAMRREVERFSPADVAGYERFMAHSRETCRIGFEQLGHEPFGRVVDMLRVAPDLIRLQAWRSVYGLVARYIQDERLRVVFSFHPLLIGGNPFTASSILCLISWLERHWGVHFAMGGTGRLIEGLVGLVEGQGGTIRYDAEVAEITTQDGSATGVRLASGETLASDIVVSNADSAYTYRRLLPAHARRRWTDRRIDRARYSMGLFVWYFGTDRQWPEVGHHTISLGPRYRALLDDVFTRKVLADDFSLYLHRPTATDPSLAPPGCDSFYVLSPVPNASAGIDWSRMAEPYRKRIEAQLEATLLPGLSQSVRVSHIATPDNFETDLLALNGAGFGLEPILTQCAWFRPHNRSEDVRNLYLVGAGTHPGAGLPGVLSSARILDRVVPHADAHVASRVAPHG